MNELEELKRQWQELEQRVTRELTARGSHEHREFAQRQLDRARRSLWPLYLGQIVLIVFGVGMIAIGVAYWSQHREWSHRFASGVLLHVYGVVTVVMGGITLGRIGAIDYTLPVVTLQERLRKLRRWYVACGATVGLPWWLLWLAFVQVVLGLIFGVDFLGHASNTFLVMNVAVGVLGLIGTWLVHCWLQRPGREELARRFADQAAGASIRRAEGLLQDMDDPEAAS